jgi:tetratricopeptide (TPR) repeat protein
MSQRKTTAAASILAAGALMSLTLTLTTGDSAFAASHHLYKGRVSQSVATADRLLVKGKYDAAAGIYRAALHKNPKDINAQVGLGMAYTKLFKLDGAQEQFDKALARDPGNPGAHAGKAMLLLSRLQSSSNTIRKNRDAMVKEAESEAQKALEADTQVPEAHYAMGMVYKEEGRFNEANNEFKESTELDPHFSDGYTGMGLVKIAQNNPGGAVSDFKQAVKVNSGDWTAHYGLGQALLNQGQIDAALKELNIAQYQFPNSWPVRLALGRAFETQGNTVAAVREYQESIRIKPENPSAYLGIANIRENRGDIEHSIAELRSGLELMPNSMELHQRVADESLRVEKVDDAIKEYETVLNGDPGNAAAADGLTNAYYLKAQKETTGGYFGSNDYEDAQKMLDRAVSMNPNDMKLRLAQAKLRALSGDDIDMSTIAPPRNDGERISYAQAMLAMNRFQDASAQMNTVIANAPNAKQTFAIGDLSLMMHDLDSAEAAYKKAASFPGAGERARRGLGQCAKARAVARKNLTLADDLSHKKMMGSAVDTYHDAIFANPRSADARLGLAKALEATAKKSPVTEREAATQYRAYVALSPTLPEKEQDKFLKRAQKLDGRATKNEAKIAQVKKPR